MRRRKLIVVATASVLLVGVGAGIAYTLATQRTADVHSGDAAPFTLTTDPPATEPGSSGNAKVGLPWPFYGRTLERTRDASDLADVHPPYVRVWSAPGGGLLEYPPSYADGVLYEAADSGRVQAFDVFTGRVLWSRKFPTIVASPAVAGRMIYFPAYDGRVWAIARASGRTVWSAVVGGRMEGSPAVWDGRVYVTGLSGQVRAFDARDGRPVWKFQASGAVKHGPAISGGRAYVGDYSGNMYCLDAVTGRLVWRVHTAGLSSGFRSGAFYSTPAVSYGRVYIGNTDGKVYSFVAATGQVAWTHTLPGWAYGSPAVSAGRVFATSYDGTFVALSARTGAVLWHVQLPYRSLSSPTVIGPLVYVADRGSGGSVHGHLYAYTPDTGRRVWQFPDGKYSTVIAAAGRLVVAGFSKIYVLRPQ